ncbi:MAG: acetyl-CoA carboxylase carboxyl transferase subunit alpha, partial [Moraxellaceae bacterium]|nr:acetyl-CoA carboxylase carboxyl transferase subunit alpha [Moraxellaceae bacterium]
MNPNYLDFEQPIAELEAKIEGLRSVGQSTGLNIDDEVAKLRNKSIKLTEEIFANLSAWQVSQLSRHPQRPYTMDYIKRLFTD